MERPEYVDRWTRLAARWLELADPDPGGAEALLRSALDLGLLGIGELPAPASAPAGHELRRCEIELVRLSGAVDEDGYRAHNPKMAEAGGDPVTNYCRSGWRNMRNPSLAFDGWWYRSEYLDPDDDELNPLLHFLLEGRFMGRLPLPQRRPRSVTRLDRSREIHRACLFAAYDPDGLVDDYVVAYVRELARFADVFVLYDGALKPGQLDRLDGLVKGSWVVAHGSYDFGSWARLARDLVGWTQLDKYDEVLLVNDSCYLLRPLDAVFAAMVEAEGDFWGLQTTARRFEPGPGEPQTVPAGELKRSWLPRSVFRYEEFVHVGSYFLALRRPAFTDLGLRKRLDVIGPHRRQLLVHRYETGTTQYLVGQGYDFTTWVPGLRGFHPIYGPGYFDLLAGGFPLLKRRFLVDNPFDTPGLGDWKARVLAAAPGAPVDLVQANLDRVGDPARIARSFSI